MGTRGIRFSMIWRLQARIRQIARDSAVYPFDLLELVGESIDVLKSIVWIIGLNDGYVKPGRQADNLFMQMIDLSPQDTYLLWAGRLQYPYPALTILDQHFTDRRGNRGCF